MCELYPPSLAESTKKRESRALSPTYAGVVAAGLVKLDAEYVKQWGEMMAGYSIAALPLVLIFLFTMRLFVKGIAAGAIKE